jgi:predicted amino acid-binding ACT domain protein
MIRKISIIAKDRVGLLSDISYILAKEKVNIEEIDAQAIEGEKAVIMLGVESNNYDKAKKALERNGYAPLPENSFIISLEDKPGELAKISKILSERKINILKVATVGRNKERNVMLVEIVVNKPKEAKRILDEYVISEYNE